MKIRSAYIVLVIASLVTGPVVAAEYPETVSGSVERIVDGDGLYLVGYEHQIRLWGIDAPERGDKGYAEAGAYLGSLTDGYQVQCNKRDVDRYERFVGQCFLPDRTDLGAAMIEARHSIEYCSFSRGFYGSCN
jgi:endonuclease YncB( thermonuclease family)